MGEEVRRVSSCSKDRGWWIFAFTCTSNYVALTKTLELPKDNFGTCIDSGTSTHYCPNCAQFQNYQPLKNRVITTVNGWTLKAIGIGDVHIDLLNGAKQTLALLRDAVYAPDMAFTLISVGRLDKGNCSVTCQKGMYTICNPKGASWAQFYRPMDSNVLPTQAEAIALTMPMLLLEKSLSARHSANLAIYPIQQSGMLFWVARLLEWSLIWIQSPNFVNPVQEPSQLEFHSQRNQTPVQWSMENRSIGTYGDQLLWRVLAETPMLPLAWMTIPMRTNSTSTPRRVILLHPINRMRHLSRWNRATKSKYHTLTEGENFFQMK